MRRPPLPRELVATLVACADNDDDQELEQLLVEHLPALSEALHKTPEALRAVCAMAPAARLARIGTLIKLAKERDQAASAQAMSRRALDAAVQVASLAKWHEGRVELDATLVLGRELRADPSRMYIRFNADGFEPVAVRREKLWEASRKVRFSDVACNLTARGLCFSWRAGKGGLVLTSQHVLPDELGAILSVVIARPVVPEFERSVVRLSKPSNVSWFIEALAHASPI